jgi:hypothetical protein
MPSTVWEGKFTEFNHMHVQSIHHLENSNVFVFKQEIPSAHYPTALGIGQSSETQHLGFFVWPISLSKSFHLGRGTRYTNGTARTGYRLLYAGFLHLWESPSSYFCQVMVSPAEKTRGHICPFYTMVIDTHVWLGISGKTGEKFRKDV